MIKVLQYGEGNFLRAFVDSYFDALNREGGNYAVTIVKPIPIGSVRKFAEQGNVYHVVLRGVRGDERVEEVYEVRSVERVIDPFVAYDEYIALAGDDELKIIVSNTTEAGIRFNPNDDFGGFRDITFPAKLAKFLYERFRLGKGGVYILPVELIDDNADELSRCVNAYIELWGLGDEFRKWNAEQNEYCNTLVDRIVSGFPRDERTREELFALVGRDELLTVGEPFGLWAVENKGEIAEYIKPGRHDIDVVITDDVGYYKKRKVRVLNGSHTNLAAVGLVLGKTTVYECMTDEATGKFVRSAMTDEIIPFVSGDVADIEAFGKEVVRRLSNPFLNHRLVDISLNGISKWRARVKPTLLAYYSERGTIPPLLAVGFSYLLALLGGVRRGEDGKFYADAPCGKVEIRDERAYLDYFASGGDRVEFMKRADAWGEDLTQIGSFGDVVRANLEKIDRGEVLI